MIPIRKFLSLTILMCAWLPATASASCRISEKAARYLPIVHATAQRHGIDPNLILAVITIESGFNHRAVSPVGAEGLMQIMPATQSDLGVNDGFNPYENVDGGARYLRDMILRYDSVRIGLTAYNAGPTRVDRGYVPAESIHYANNVLRKFWCYREREVM